MKWKVKPAAMVLLLAGPVAFAFSFWQLSLLMPEQLVAAQINRPIVEGNPANLILPAWLVDLHWSLFGERIVDRENKAHTQIAKFMLGAELRRLRGADTFPFDKERFRQLMRHYVCESPSGIAGPEEIARYRDPSKVPEYMGALEYCGRIPARTDGAPAGP